MNLLQKIASLFIEDPPISSRVRRLPTGPRRTAFLWEERKWRPSGNTLHGYYRTRRGAFKGRIEKYNSSSPQFYIIKPPRALLSGPHGGCFIERGSDQFWVHFNKKPKHLDAGILHLERMLLEASQ